MYLSKYAKGAVPIGDFIRYEKGAETFYECVGNDASKTMGFLQSHVNRVKCKTMMQKFLLIDDKALTIIPVVKVTIVTPAPPRQKRGAKLGSKRPKQKTDQYKGILEVGEKKVITRK